MPTDLPDPFPWMALLGRAHVVVLHLPLGLVPALALLEFGAVILRRPVPRGPILALSWLCALTAAVAVASGLLLADEGDLSGDRVTNHKITGIALGSICLVVAIAACFRGRAAFRVLLLLACIVMVPTGHLGGSLSHDPDFLFEPLQPKSAPRDRSGDGATPANAGDGPAQAAANRTEFERTIRPILERTCTKCHNPDKTKGELLLTTVEGIRKGGENGEVLVPGRPDESEIYVRCTLPLDDDDHMPPEGKPQPSQDELATLRAWIEAGAKFE
ncbi:MAG: hypothetical protein KDC98_11805 [Planctomycetes bacterium]|nr:hypothetical protein [Planctomycetota bacterium]